MAETQPREAVIDVLPTHLGRLEPAVQEVHDRLLRRTVEFAPAGPLGHTAVPVVTDEFVEVYALRRYDAATGNVERVDVMRLTQGVIPDAVGWLKGLGVEVEVRDHRKDSRLWVRDKEWRKKTPQALRKVVAAVGANKALRAVAGSLDLIADTVVAVARAYPHARIAVAVPTYRLLWRIWGRLRWRLGNEWLGLYTAKQKKPARVSVGLIKQLPPGTKGDFDLLVLPFAEQTVFDDALRVITSGQYRRLLSFTPTRWTRDEHLNRRLLVVAGSVFPPEKEKVPVTAVVLTTHGSRPTGRFEGALDAKRRLYVHNARRNRRVAEVANRLRLGTKKAVRSLGIDGPGLVELVLTAARLGVAVLVETPEHARELAALLPGWAVWTGGVTDVTKPEPGCGVVVTEQGADEFVVNAGVLVRATGTRHPLPEVDWPWVGDVDHGVLVDFADQYHPAAHKNAVARVESYLGGGMTVWEAHATKLTEVR